jgi:hypothetical protein
LTQSGQREPESEKGPCSRPVLNSLGPTHRAAGAIGQDERRCDRRPANVIASGGTSGSCSHATRQRTSGSPSDIACAPRFSDQDPMFSAGELKRAARRRLRKTRRTDFATTTAPQPENYSTTTLRKLTDRLIHPGLKGPQVSVPSGQQLSNNF